MDQAELERRCEDPQFWRELVPWLGVGDGAKAPVRARAAAEVTAQQASLLEDGYFELDALVRGEDVEPLARGVARLHERGIRPVFIAVYDELWGLVAGVLPALEAVLGGPVAVVPDVWAWYADASTDSGFSPHRDWPEARFLDRDRRPTAVTAWIALSDAPASGSCIYVLPASFDPSYPDALASREVKDLKSVRALPARRGTVLGWNLGLLHWGSRAGPRARPRLSVGIFVQRRDCEPLYVPWLDLGRPLPFRARLGVIGKNIGQYVRNADARVRAHARALELNLVPESLPVRQGGPQLPWADVVALNRRLGALVGSAAGLEAAFAGFRDALAAAEAKAPGAAAAGGEVAPPPPPFADALRLVLGLAVLALSGGGEEDGPELSPGAAAARLLEGDAWRDALGRLTGGARAEARAVVRGLVEGFTVADARLEVEAALGAIVLLAYLVVAGAEGLAAAAGRERADPADVRRAAGPLARFAQGGQLAAFVRKAPRSLRALVARFPG